MKKPLKEYLRTGFWLWLGNLLTGVIVLIIYGILFVILLMIGAIGAEIGSKELMTTLSAIGFIVWGALVLVYMLILGLIFDKYIRKRI